MSTDLSYLSSGRPAVPYRIDGHLSHLISNGKPQQINNNISQIESIINKNYLAEAGCNSSGHFQASASLMAVTGKLLSLFVRGCFDVGSCNRKFQYKKTIRSCYADCEQPSQTYHKHGIHHPSPNALYRPRLKSLKKSQRCKCTQWHGVLGILNLIASMLAIFFLSQ